MVEQVGELSAQEAGNDGGWRLIGSESVGIGGTHDGSLDESVVTVHAHEGLDDEYHEAQIVLGSLARSVEQHARVGREAPVVVLTRTIDAGKGLLVEQHTEPVAARNLLHDRHDKHIVVYSQVALLEDGRQLKLVGRNLVVTGLAGDAKGKSLDFQVLHKGLNALRDGSEVVVVHLLVLGRVVTHKGTAGKHQVGTREVESFVYEEVFLLPTQVGLHLLDIGVEVLCHSGGSLSYCAQRAEQRRLVVERLAGIRDEDGGYTEGVVDDEHGRCGVPSRIAACLKRVAYSS